MGVSVKERKESTIEVLGQLLSKPDNVTVDGASLSKEDQKDRDALEKDTDNDRINGLENLVSGGTDEAGSKRRLFGPNAGTSAKQELSMDQDSIEQERPTKSNDGKEREEH